MRVDFLTKNYNVSERLRDLIEKKVERLDKFFEPDTKIKVFLRESNDVKTLELTILLDSTVLRAEVASDNMYENIDLALPKLEKQVIKHRTRLMSKSKKFRIKDLVEDAAAPPDEKKSSVVKSKTYELTPMTVEDAIEELELVGHSFYVFADKSTKAVNVLYRRNDGDYGLIETVF
jgi:putative sigma-54 modulation protein